MKKKNKSKKVEIIKGYNGYKVGETKDFIFHVSTCYKLFVMLKEGDTPDFEFSDYPAEWKAIIIKHLCECDISELVSEISYCTDAISLHRGEAGQQDISSNLAVFTSLEAFNYHTSIRLRENLVVKGIEMIRINIIENLVMYFENKSPF